MSETLQYNTLWDILENIGIEIPPIQRDYAQGREIAKVDKIRNEFLDPGTEPLTTKMFCSGITFRIRKF